ncbi:MAG: hypothetical protein CMP08_00145 [Xanthomonadales bacterium]|nr:hypothetical protein [Xanthomonadales bacterium]
MKHETSPEPPAPLPIDYDTVHVVEAAHQAALVDELAHRGSRVVAIEGDLVMSAGRPGVAAWASNSWLAPAEYSLASINEAARTLKAIQRNWHGHHLAHFRRAELIAAKLPTIRFRPLAFPSMPPAAPLGAWSLVARDRMIVSPRCSRPFADGQPVFVEDRHGPPNRAYLKLWEALTLARHWPVAGQRCLDLGASPGGWSWVLAELGADVLAIDRAPLAPAIAHRANVHPQAGDAFAIDIDTTGPVDWVCSDLIAYPERLLALAHYWCRAAPRANVILTVKCQGTVDTDLIAAFYEIPGARLAHLSANKHELTFFRLADGGPAEAARWPADA